MSSDGHFLEKAQFGDEATFHVSTSPKARISAAVKNIDAPMLTRVWQELEYRIDVCRLTRCANIEHI